MEYKIEKASLKRINEINTLINSAYRGETSKKGWTTEANILEGKRTTEPELIELINQKYNNLFVYIEEDKVLGTVLLIEKPDKLYLGMLTVNPELQNKGIGKILINYAEIFAKELNLSKIEMTVISLRHELIAYYNRNGYFDTGLREPFPSEYNNDVIHNEPLEFIILEKNL